MKNTLSFFLACLCTQLLFAGETDTLEVFSPAMKKNVKCVVITPAKYLNGKKHFPVVYLFHGYSGSYSQWPTIAPQLAKTADDLQMILVCPDGGYGSWYIDSPVDSNFKYDTFVSGELVAFIDKKYPTLADRSHRAITGLSMGGHGGLYLAMRHKEEYGAAGSTSGGVDIRPFPKNWDLKKRLGDSSCCQANWERNTVINIADSLENKQLRLIVDCGVDDFFIQVNRNLHAKLLQMKIEHDYIERPGKHNAAYWQNSIDYQLVFFHKYFEGL